MAGAITFSQRASKLASKLIATKPWLSPGRPGTVRSRSQDTWDEVSVAESLVPLPRHGSHMTGRRLRFGVRSACSSGMCLRQGLRSLWDAAQCFRI